MRLNPQRLPAADWQRATGYSGSERVDVVRPGGGRAVRGAVPFVWCHGFTLASQPADIAVTADYNDRLAAIAALGHPVLSADLGGGSTWGNDTAIARVNSLLTWANTNYGTRLDKVAIGGESMGSLLAFNWAWRNPAKVAALWVRAPLTALDALHDRNVSLAGAIEGAYGGLSGYNAALSTHDPAQNRTALRALGGLTRVEYTLDDEVVLAGEVIDHIEATDVAEHYAWPGTHDDNRWTDTWAVAEWVHDTVRGIAA